MNKNSTHRSFASGSYQELIEDIGPIPRGVYRLLDQEEDTLFFQIGNAISFAVIGNWQDKVISVPRQRGSLRCTTQSKFLDRYYELLGQAQKHPPEVASDQLFTMCCIDPSLAREVH